MELVGPTEKTPMLARSPPIHASTSCGCFGGAATSHELIEFADYDLYDAKTRRPTKLRALWERAPVVLVFLRRLGCQLCRLRASEFEAARPIVAQAGANIVCVTFEYLGEGSDYDNSWSLVACWTGALLADPSQVLFRRLFRRKGLFDGFYGLTDMSRARVAQSSALGFNKQSNIRGDGLMLGGVCVVDVGGEVMLDHRSKYFGDDVPIRVVLDTLRRTPGGHVLPLDNTRCILSSSQRPPVNCAVPTCLIEKSDVSSTAPVSRVGVIHREEVDAACVNKVCF